MIEEKKDPSTIEEAYEEGMEYPFVVGKIRVQVTDYNKDAVDRLEAIKEILDELDRVKEGDSDE